MMKFAFFLVVALVAVQGFQARSVEYQDRDLQDVIEAIKNIIAKIGEAISNAASNLGEILKNIANKIKEAIENANIPGIIQKIRDAIEKLIQEAGEIARNCIESRREDLEAIISNAQSGVEACRDAAEAQTADLQAQIQNLVAAANALRDDVIARALQCVRENVPNPVAIANCLKAQVDPIREELAALEAQIKATIALARETAEKVGADLSQCIGKVQQETQAAEEKLLGEIRECIQNTVQP